MRENLNEIPVRFLKIAIPHAQKRLSGFALLLTVIHTMNERIIYR